MLGGIEQLVYQQWLKGRLPIRNFAARSRDARSTDGHVGGRYSMSFNSLRMADFAAIGHLLPLPSVSTSMGVRSDATCCFWRFDAGAFEDDAMAGCVLDVVKHANDDD